MDLLLALTLIKPNLRFPVKPYVQRIASLRLFVYMRLIALALSTVAFYYLKTQIDHFSIARLTLNL